MRKPNTKDTVTQQPSSDYLPLLEFAKLADKCYQSISRYIKNGIITDYAIFKNKCYVHKSQLENLKNYYSTEIETPEGYISRKQIASELNVDDYSLSRIITSGIMGKPKKISRQVFIRTELYLKFKNMYLANKAKE